MNVFSLHQLFANPLPIKIVLVAQEAWIDDRKGPFYKTLDRITRLFQGTEELKDSLSLVITKQKEIINTRKFLQSILNEQGVENQYLQNPNVRDLLQFLANKAQCVRRGLFLPS